MSVSRTKPLTYTEKLQKAEVRKAIKKVTGSDLVVPKCAICGETFTDKELINYDLVYAVSKTQSVQFHRKCFNKEFSTKKGKKVV